MNDCQKERKRLWQLRKRHEDPDYKDNQNRAQHAWSEANPLYWREYRDAHPGYEQKNRSQQTERNARAEGNLKTDVELPATQLLPKDGLYVLIDESSDDVAKKDAWLVRLTLVSAFKVKRQS
jgi:hypothetical protein